MKNVKIEIDGGVYNGAERYYKNTKCAVIASKRLIKEHIKKNVLGSIFIDIYYIDTNYKKILITTLTD